MKTTKRTYATENIIKLTTLNQYKANARKRAIARQTRRDNKKFEYKRLPDAVQLKKVTRSTRVKKTADQLLAQLPKLPEGFSYNINAKNAVHVLYGKKRVFGFSGPVIVVNRKDILTGISYEERKYGCRVEPTSANFARLINNFYNVYVLKKSA